MPKWKEPRIKHKSEPAVVVKEIETEAIKAWLRIVDQPLATEKKDRTDAKSIDR